MTTCSIKERSLIAKLAAKKLGVKSVAIVIGRTIHLHNTSREEFLSNPRWVRHELAHVRQFAEHGFLPFLFHYLVESMRVGYHRNKFEAAARAAENDTQIADTFKIK